MGGFSSSAPRPVSAPSALDAVVYTMMVRQDLVNQGKAAPLTPPPLPPPPEPQRIVVQVPVPNLVPVPVQVPNAMPQTAPRPTAPTPATPSPGGSGGTAITTPRPTAETEAARRRREQLERQDRGHAATLGTSLRGVLTPLTGLSTRKTLLGE